ncbi:MAG TPA: LemA family protein [Chryseolinea sp.]|jgi:LemA protein|nr:LemA family protein [Chryseolinea sp.]
MGKWIGIGALVILVLWIFSSYNGLVRNEETVSSQWGTVESQYQRRTDLIPNLVNTVKGYAQFEQETLTKVIEARANATSVKIDPTNITPEKLQQFQQAQEGVTSALSRLLVVVEKYPDLKANQNFLDLQSQLEGTENRIAVERKRYNDVVIDYNNSVRTFPGVVVAKITGFQPKAYFEAAEGAERAPTVTF